LKAEEAILASQQDELKMSIVRLAEQSREESVLHLAVLAQFDARGGKTPRPASSNRKKPVQAGRANGCQSLQDPLLSLRLPGIGEDGD